MRAEAGIQYQSGGVSPLAAAPVRFFRRRKGFQVAHMAPERAPIRVNFSEYKAEISETVF